MVTSKRRRGPLVVALLLPGWLGHAQTTGPAATPAKPGPAPAAAGAISPTTPPLSLEQALAGLKGSGAPLATLELSSEGKPLGRVRCELLADKAPQAVAAFVGLARGLLAFKDPHNGQWQKKLFYDGMPIHRVIADFMLQGGDPKCSGDAQCMFSPGSGDPGFVLPDEIRPELRFDQGGLLALANRGAGTGGSQFFITVRAATWLTGHHTIFGLCDNLPLLEKLSQVETSPNDVPKIPILIQRLTVSRKPK